jgi:hypothetical protein
VNNGFASKVVDAYLAEVNSLDSNPLFNSWYLDLGTLNHIYGDKFVFSSLTSSSGTKVTSAGGHGHSVTGIGSIAIHLPNSEIQKITHVLYSPNIIKNLLLVGFLTNKGFRLEF